MYNLSQVVQGMTKYLDNEIMPKITGWQKWIVGTGIALSLNKSVDVFNEIKKNKYIMTLGIIDKDDNIDVDTLYKEILKQAKKSAVTFELPVVGVLTLNERDVTSLYNYIKRGD